jgi:hypothetical protein
MSKHISNILLLASALLLPYTARAQIICALGADASSYDVYADQSPSGDAMELAGRVNTALKPSCLPTCPTVEIFRNATAPNAMLRVDSDQAKMVYAPQFFTAVYEKYGEGAIIAIIAHEVGHAIDLTTPAAWMKLNWTPELRADAWAGCALAKVNLSKRGLVGALTALSMYPSPSHPNWPSRIGSLRLGYTHCGGDGSEFDSRVATIRR